MLLHNEIKKNYVWTLGIHGECVFIVPCLKELVIRN